MALERSTFFDFLRLDIFYGLSLLSSFSLALDYVEVEFAGLIGPRFESQFSTVGGLRALVYCRFISMVWIAMSVPTPGTSGLVGICNGASF